MNGWIMPATGAARPPPAVLILTIRGSRKAVKITT